MFIQKSKSLRYLACVSIALILLCTRSYHTHAETSPPPEDILTVVLGQSLLLGYAGVTRVAVGDGELIQVEVLKNEDEVLLIALKPGITDLRLWSTGDEPTRFVIRVHDDAEYVSVDDINRLLSDIEGVSVEQLGKTIALQGKVINNSDFERVQAIAERYASVTSYVSAPVFERNPTILMNAKLLEVRRSALKELGISWNNIINGPALGYLADFGNNPLFRLTDAPDGSALPLSNSGTQRFSGISTSLSSTINLLIDNGDARLLAEPSLACVSGGEADFLVGGEVPIPVRDDNGSVTVEFKQFGIILNFAPLVDEDRVIRTDVGIEVSSVDPAIQVLGIPGFATRKTNSKMNVSEGQTMVIAGLVSHEDAKNVSKLPVLGQIPILGELFKSRQFRNQETELIVLITPQIANENSRKQIEYQQRFEDLSQTAEKRLKFNILD